MVTTTQHFMGAVITILAFVFLGIYSGKKIRSADDFSVSGRNAGGALVAGTILGTMIGGASTIGTAQMAFMKGISAWWFTLGGGISCLIFCLVFARPFRQSKNITITGIIQKAYGKKAALAATVFLSVAMIVNIIPQIVSATALISSFFAFSLSAAAVIAVFLMIVYVFFGGVWGTGLLGILKTVLTAGSLLAGGGLVLWLFGGAAGMYAAFPRYPWFSFWGQKIGSDISSLVSLVIGVLSGQTYLQAIVAARSLRSARAGTLISAAVGPLIGLGGVLIGLFMRAKHPEIIAVQALPLFVTWYLPDWLAGVVLATLLFAVIGSGAGIVMGACTILSNVYQKLFPKASDKNILIMFRTSIIVLFGFALTVVLLSGGEAVILNWSYLSHGFRGVSAFLPMVTALFLRDKIEQKAAVWASVLPPIMVAIWVVFKPLPMEPLYPGLLMSLLLYLWGYIKAKRESTLKIPMG
ncbi:MAG: sodium:solute symporter family protein [Firmicutes bacterium]|nr:sodium:solute symporter family protein [Bacillota bacterium]